MRFRRFPLLAVAIVTVALVTNAVTADDLKIETYSLPNGLRVVLNEDHSAPLVAVNVWYHVGSKNERVGRTGFAHLFEHMLFSGSQNVGNNEHFRYVESVGGLINGSTNFDRTNYFETIPSNHLALGLWLEADRMGFFLPALTQKKLDIQKEVVKEERRQRYDNVPYGTALERGLRLGFKKEYPYSWPTIGAMPDLTAASLEDVTGFFKTYYSPNNAVLTLVGDFDSAEAKMLVEKYFGEIPRGPEVPAFTAVREPTGEQREVFASPVQLPRVYRIVHIPPVGQHDWFVADLLSTILAGDKSSRLNRVLVHEKQIAQDANGFVFGSEGTGMLYLQVTAKPGVSAEALEKALDEQLDRVRSGGVTEEELMRAKNQNETGFARQIENFGSRADNLSRMTTFFGDPSMINRWLERYRVVTRDEVQEVATRYLTPENGVTMHFVPASQKPASMPKGGSQ